MHFWDEKMINYIDFILSFFQVSETGSAWRRKGIDWFGDWGFLNSHPIPSLTSALRCLKRA